MIKDTEFKKLVVRVEKLEKIIFSKKKENKKVTGSKESLPKHIITLRDSGFFKQLKTAENVHKKLEPSYSCSLNRVVVALGRLQRRRQLRKNPKLIGKKKYIAYVW